MAVDTKQLSAFAADVERLNKGLPDFFLRFAKRMGLELVKRTKLRTPVDTGLLRNSWDVGRVTYEASTGQIIITLINPVHYAFYVENGHRTSSGSWVEGRFMAKIAIDTIMEDLPRAYQKALAQYVTQMTKG